MSYGEYATEIGFFYTTVSNYSQSNVTLNSGWNLISLSMRQGDSGTNRNISLASGWLLETQNVSEE